jgi:hypothetical protein
MQAVPTGQENNQLETLDISTQDGKDFPWGRANGYQWDVMVFAESMDWDK